MIPLPFRLHHDESLTHTPPGRYGEYCALLHGEVCEYCQCQVLHPYDPEQQRRHRADCLSSHERDMEHSFRMAKSIDKACGICMEVVVEKVGALRAPIGEMFSVRRLYKVV